jgi:hypothetical protein
VIGIQPLQGGYRAFAEVVEQEEYMKRIGRDGLLCIYEVDLDDRLEILRYGRKASRVRTEVPTDEEVSVGESLTHA